MTEILIISKANLELTTNSVCDWLNYYQVPFIRINVDQITDPKYYSVLMDINNHKLEIFDRVNRRKIDLEHIDDKSVMYGAVLTVLKIAGPYRGILIPSTLNSFPNPCITIPAYTVSCRLTVPGILKLSLDGPELRQYQGYSTGRSA